VRLPLDYLYLYHQFAGFGFSLCALIHVGAHLYNLYIASELTADAVNCALNTQFHDGRVPSTWSMLTTTIPGVTGILLLICVLLITPFSFEAVRRASFAVFHAIHKLYIVIYPLILLHGALGMLASPNGWKYVTVPFVLLLIEKYFSRTAEPINTVEIYQAQVLPGKAIRVTARRPPGWNFRSGQYVHITCPAISRASAHPFTIASAPQEPLLQFTIKAVGPWTDELRMLCVNKPVLDEQVLANHGSAGHVLVVRCL
jgi:predicted ferric reductase